MTTTKEALDHYSWLKLNGLHDAPSESIREGLYLFRAFTQDPAILQFYNELEAELANRGEYLQTPQLVKKHTDGHVYIIQAGPYYKIGITRNLDRRIDELSRALPIVPTLIHSVQSANMYLLEKKLHFRFSAKRTNGEWFTLSNEDVEWLRGLA